MLPTNPNTYSEQFNARTKIIEARSTELNHYEGEYVSRIIALNDDTDKRYSICMNNCTNIFLASIGDPTAMQWLTNSPYASSCDTKAKHKQCLAQVQEESHNIGRDSEAEANELHRYFEEQRQRINTQYDKMLQDLENTPVNTAGFSPTTSCPITYITVKFDAGYGNSLSICGNGPKMSWDLDKAVPLRCIGGDTWIYETDQNFEGFSYKIVLNNRTWEDSGDRSIQKHTPHQFTPSFPR